jgi:two-component system, OmpR family, response regulator
MKILIVDDSPDSADGLAAVIAQLGHVSVVAYDMSTAFRLALETSYDVILFDITLPDGDGRELCERLRSEGASQEAWMIAVTGRVDLTGRDFESFDGYMHKPITWPALKHTLEMWCAAAPSEKPGSARSSAEKRDRLKTRAPDCSVETGGRSPAPTIMQSSTDVPTIA